MLNTVRTLARHGSLLYRWVLFSITVTYAESVFGFAWVVAQPVIRSLLFTFIAAYVFRARIAPGTGPADYAVYILCGMIPWLALQQGVIAATNSVINYRHIVTEMIFPMHILPIYGVIAETFTQLVGFAVLAGLLIFTDYGVGPHLLWLVVPIAGQFLFAAGLGYLLACFAVWVRDLVQIMPHFFYVWMILSPLYYTGDMLPEKARIILKLNPVSGMFNMYHDVVMNARAPAARDVLIFSLTAAAVFAVGSAVFDRLRYYAVDQLG
ncbi:MAG: ABC transporter permease [bacterium]